MPAPAIGEPSLVEQTSGPVSHTTVSPNESSTAAADLPSSYRTLYGQRIIDDYHKRLGLFKGKEQPIPQVPHGDLPICIIGAGAAGLYSAMMLESLKLKYEILEASDRVGGRLFTYEFSKTPYDYYDVGAMRFPKTPYMKSTFDLFDKLNVHKLKYYLEAKNTFLYYNGQRYQRPDDALGPQPPLDPFNVAKPKGDVPKEYVDKGFERLVNDTLMPFRQEFLKGPDAGFAYLQTYDTYSTRAYMALVMNYPQTVIEWCETMDKSTGWYDRSLAETVLESMAFDYPNNFHNKDSKPTCWYCVDGGTKVFAEAMANSLQDKPLRCKKRVTDISLGQDGDSMSVKVLGEDEPRTYSHVISTIPLPVLRTVNLDGCNLDYGTRNALRTLSYGPSIKVGIKFKTNWWQDKFGIIGGQSYTDLPSRTIVYPSFGPGDEKSSVLIVSYCWTQDALRMGSLITPERNTESEEILLNQIFHDLAAVHDTDVQFMRDQYDGKSYFPWDWYHDDLTMGAFAFFGPGEFYTIYPHVTNPSAGGRLHTVGEATSTNHAWVAGALDSAWRGVYEVLKLSYPKRVKEFTDMYPHPEEWSPSVVDTHIHAGLRANPPRGGL